MFEPTEEKGPPLTYKKQIDEINKFFSWDILCLKMADGNPILMREIYSTRLQDILDYLVVNKQSNQIEEWKNSKNIISI